MNLENTQKLNLLLFIIVILELTIYIILDLNKNISISDFSIIFNNLLTPLVTLLALVIYYLSLVEMKRQTSHLMEDKKILLSKNTYQDFIIKVRTLKDDTTKQKLGHLLSNYTEIEFTLLDIYHKSNIIDIIYKIKTDKKYNFIINKSEFEKIDIEEMLDYSSSNKDYLSVNSIYFYYNSFLEKIYFIINQIRENEILHESHKKQLIELIAKEILYEYFLFVMNKHHFDFKLFINLSIGKKDKIRSAFELYQFEKIVEFYKKRYPEIIDEIMFLKL